MINDDEYENLKSQRDMLFGGLKKIATDDNTPDKIRVFLNSLAKKVIELKSKQPMSPVSNKPFEVGDIVLTTNNKICRYRIEKIYDDSGVRSCTLRTIWVKDNLSPIDGVHSNIPLNLLKHYK